MAEDSPARRQAIALVNQAQATRDQIRRGAFWPGTAEFDYAVRRVYDLEEAAEAALNQLAT